MEVDRILRRHEVEARIGLTTSPLYARIKSGEFPKPVPRGNSKAVGWLESEVNAWIAAQIAKRAARERGNVA